MLVIHKNWGTRESKAALQKEIWGFGLRACWIWVNSVPWQPKEPTVSRNASSTAQLADWGRWLSHYRLHWCGPTLSTVCSFGCLSIRTSSYENVSRGEWPRWWNVSRARLTRIFWAHLACSAWRREVWGVDDLILKGGNGRGDADLLSLVPSNRIWGNGMKLHQEKFRLNIRKSFFTEGVISHWNRLSTEMVMLPRLSEFKERLDYGLVLGSPVRKRELDSMILMCSLQLKIFSDSMILVI